MERSVGLKRSGRVATGERAASLALAMVTGWIAYASGPGRTRSAFGATSALAAARGLGGWCPFYAGWHARLDGDTRAALGGGRGIFVRQGVTVRANPEEVYRFWRDLSNLPRFLAHVRHVEDLSATRSRWTVRAPLGQSVSWEAEIINDLPGQVIGWQSCPGAPVATAGSVRFREAPGARGTEVVVTLQYAPPGGKLGAGLAALFGHAPELTIREDLRRLKQLLEAGEVAVATPAARDDLAKNMQTTLGPEVRDDLEPSWSHA